jgi:hypothetical protein
MSRRWLFAAIAGILLVLAFVWLRRRGAGPEEVAELVGTGAEKVLREPMRLARGGPRVLLIAIDGVGDGALRQALAEGRMPRLAGLLGPRTPDPDLFAHGYAAPGVLSILPSTTFAAWTSTFTGQPAAVTGVTGNEWWDRAEGRFYAPAPASVAGVRHALEVYSDQLMSHVVRAPSLYERANVRSYVSLAALQRGADLVTIPDPTALGRLTEALARGMANEDAAKRDAYAALDRDGVASMLEVIRKRGVADLQTVYFPAADLYTHVAADPLAEQQRYLAEVVDVELGRILDAYRRRGALRETWVVVIADHGHTPVLADDRHALEASGDDEPSAVLRRAGFRVREPELEPEAAGGDFQAVLAYQGAMAYVYLADRSRCPRPGDRCDWRGPPRLAEDVLPVAEAFRAASETGAGVPGLRGTLDLVLARPPVAVTRPSLPFQVWDGRRLWPVGEWLREHPRPDLVELERRLDGLSAGPHGHNAGDVLLLARSGLERPLGERFYFSGYYHSWHGSPTAQDSRIPLVVARADASGAQIRDRVRRAVGARPDQLSITPLVLDLLTR